MKVEGCKGRQDPRPSVLQSTVRPASVPSLAYVVFPAGPAYYAKSTNLPQVLGGLGIAILSTSSGLLTDKQAAKKGGAAKSSLHLVVG